MARADPMLERIEAFNRGRGGGVVVRRAAKGYSLYSERSGGPVARLKPTGEDDKVRRGRQGPRAGLAPRKMGGQWTVRRPHYDARPRLGLYRFKPVLLDSRLIQPKNAQSRAEKLFADGACQPVLARMLL